MSASYDGSSASSSTMFPEDIVIDSQVVPLETPSIAKKNAQFYGFFEGDPTLVN